MAEYYNIHIKNMVCPRCINAVRDEFIQCGYIPESVLLGEVKLIKPISDTDMTIEFKTVASGLTSPIAMGNAGDDTNRLFIADQTGKIYVIQNDALLQDPFLDITDKLITLDTVYDERGLLGLAFHPDYKNNGRFFIYYSKPKSGEDIDHESILSEYKV